MPRNIRYIRINGVFAIHEDCCGVSDPFHFAELIAEDCCVVANNLTCKDVSKDIAVASGIGADVDRCDCDDMECSECHPGDCECSDCEEARSEDEEEGAVGEFRMTMDDIKEKK